MIYLRERQMKLELKINAQLNRHPKLKRIIKRIYQRMMCVISTKIKSEGNIKRMSPDDAEHDFFLVIMISLLGT